VLAGQRARDAPLEADLQGIDEVGRHRAGPLAPGGRPQA
jgi:hypothetical protein